MIRRLRLSDVARQLLPKHVEGTDLACTHAGLILLAKRLVEEHPEPLGLMDVIVARNGFGRQVDSFETELDIASLSGGAFHAVFIRAPIVVEVGPGVEAIAWLDDETIVAAQQDNLLATAFHPELTDDPRMHRFFLRMVDCDVPA